MLNLDKVYRGQPFELYMGVAAQGTKIQRRSAVMSRLVADGILKSLLSCTLRLDSLQNTTSEI